MQARCANSLQRDLFSGSLNIAMTENMQTAFSVIYSVLPKVFI